MPLNPSEEELDPADITLSEGLFEAARNDEGLLPLVQQAVHDALWFRNQSDLLPSLGVQLPELCCLKEMDLIYSTAISRGGGRDCPTVALAVKQHLHFTFPGLWEMMKSRHALHDAGLPMFTGPRDNATLILRAVDWSLDRTSQIRRITCPSCNRAWRIIILNRRSLSAFSLIMHSLPRRDTYIAKELATTLAGMRFRRAPQLPPTSWDGVQDLLILSHAGIAFMAAHEAAHAHISHPDPVLNEFVVDDIAASYIAQRSTKMFADNITATRIGGSLLRSDQEKPVWRMYAGIELMLNYLDFESAIIRSRRRHQYHVDGAPLPKDRFERISKRIQTSQALGLVSVGFEEWKNSFVSRFSDRLLEIEEAYFDN